MYTAVLSAKPKKKNGKFITQDFVPLYYHLIFEQLKYIKKTFKDKDVVICLDGNGSWRKDFYPEYKANRIKDPSNDKDEINWEEWYSAVNEIIEVLKDFFPFKVLGVKKAEADDIIAILAKEMSLKEEVIIFSEDKDFHQLISPGVRQYRPISKKWIQMTPEQVEEFKIHHALLGDSIDNIPRVVDQTEFTEAFKEFLRNNDIFEEDVFAFKQMSISEKLFDEFNIYKKIKSGHNKGKFSETKDIYKTVMFGEKAVLKFADNLEVNLAKNPLYGLNYERNKNLILFEYIPKNIQDNVLTAYGSLSVSFNAPKILEFFNKYMLREQVKDASVFFQGEPDSEVDFGW
jgi:hypothetical protein